MNIQPKCQSVRSWLKSNLGKSCLGVLTGTDSRALSAAVQIVELWCYHQTPEVERAFGLVVQAMQPSARQLAYHAIAHCADWRHRAELWEAAGLPRIEKPWLCSFEDGGSHVDHMEKKGTQ